MPRRVFFSFHYERDISRANVVRNCWLTKEDREEAGFWDASLWEEAKRKGHDSVKKMIDEGLMGTSITAVLIGSDTFGREWVGYEIIESYKRGNGLLGIYLNNIRDLSGHTDMKGRNPFENIYLEPNGKRTYFSELYPTYEWILDNGFNNGYNNFAIWVEKAATAAGR
jgi:hypothetical protein